MSMNPVFRTLFLFAPMLAFFLTACTADYLEMSTEFKTELCVVKANRGKPVSLLTDKGYALNPVSELDSTQFKPGSRYLVTYIVVDSTLMLSSQGSAGYSVRVKEMQYVLIKPVLPVDQLTQPVHGDDPVNLLSEPWLGGGYLNVKLMLNYDNEDIKHSLWMIADTTLTENGSLNTYLTLLHNANGDKQTKTVTNIVSFDCANLPYRETSDSLIIRVKQWGNTNQQVQQVYRIQNTAKRKLAVLRY